MPSRDKATLPLPGLHWRMSLLVTSNDATPTVTVENVKNKKKKPSRFARLDSKTKTSQPPRSRLVQKRTISQSCPSIPPDTTAPTLSPLIRDMQTQARSRAYDRASLLRLERATQPLDEVSLEIFDNFRVSSHDFPPATFATQASINRPRTLCASSDYSSLILLETQPIDPRLRSNSTNSGDSYIFVAWQSTSEDDTPPPNLQINFPRPQTVPTLSYGKSSSESSASSGRELRKIEEDDNTASTSSEMQEKVREEGEVDVTQSWLEAQIQEAMGSEVSIRRRERRTELLIASMENCRLVGEGEAVEAADGEEEAFGEDEFVVI